VSAGSTTSSSTSSQSLIPSTTSRHHSRRRGRRRPRPSLLLACGAELAALRPSPLRRPALMRADGDRRASLTTSDPGHALATRPRGRARRRGSHRPRLYEVAVAAAVPVGNAWLYRLITDGLALVAYGATSRLTGSGARYA
jgi:hypothetical protein